MPQINIEIPPPEKVTLSRKRKLSTASPQSQGPHPTRARNHDTTGLTILPAGAEGVWKIHFPGNAPGLSKILLSWSHAMQSFSDQLPASKLLPFLPGFPYRVQRPNLRQLVSIGFYDTSVQPNKEVRFLGQGDVAEMSYCEVDTFRSKDNVHYPNGRFAKLEEKLELLHGAKTHHIPLQQRGTTGEERWCYILIKGHASPQHGAAPQVMLALPISAITDQSSCSYTVLLDDYEIMPSINLNQPYEHTMKQAIWSPDLESNPCHTKHIQQTLRSADGMELPHVDHLGTYNLNMPEGAQVLDRTTLQMKKAGRLPLVEGSNVDLDSFRDWIDAVGRGEGKVIMWEKSE
ncbi:hypothetical protein J1614_010095 [Plenodomus biglobosus]|nr:hypothetical protein J1614_010095 [Plenodomus biglobosus]